MERNDPPAEGDMAAALRFAIEAKRLESVREMERRSNETTQTRLQTEQVEEADRSERVRIENEKMDTEAEEREQRQANDIARSIEAAQQQSRDRQAADIRLLEENRQQSSR